MSEAYRQAGVDIEAGEQAVELIKPLVASTHRSGVIGGIGGFGAMFDLAATGYRDPLLVSGTDGVGTKAELARHSGRLDTVGIDLVAMCVDDLVCAGAAPLFFLDYVAVGRLDPEQMRDLVAGIAEGCRQAGCALIGGEMAEHPGVMEADQFDLVGFAVGAVERDAVLDGSAVTPGDALIGIHSPNLRSNGFSLARRLMFDTAGRSLDDPAWDGAEQSAVDIMLEPSVIYAPAVVDLMASVEVHAVAHITGGGLPGNLNRVLGDSSDAEIDGASWEWPRIFSELQAIGDVPVEEMAKVFNLGVGMVLAVPDAAVADAIAALAASGHRAGVIGSVVPGSGAVRIA